jgi:hypothetical protein
MLVRARRVEHAFTVRSELARNLAIQFPGTAARFYLEASEPAAGAEGSVDSSRIGDVAASTGITTVLGPSPFTTP